MSGLPQVNPLGGGMITHRVRSVTETLGGLAQLYYGDWTMWRHIYDHNVDVLDQNGCTLNHLTPRTELVIPYHPNMRVPVLG